MSLIEKIANYSSVIIFGAGDWGNKVHADIKGICEKCGISVFFADNAIEKQNTDKGVFCPADAKEQFPNALWVIGSTLYGQQMYQELLELGVEKDNVCFDHPPPHTHTTYLLQ